MRDFADGGWGWDVAINAEIGVEMLAALQAASMQTWVVSIPWGRELALCF